MSKSNFEISLDIEGFIKHHDLLNDQSFSPAQTTCVKAVYGLPLSNLELEIYQRATGRETHDLTEQREVTFIAGRRSGKTGKIASAIAVFEACRAEPFPPGEYAYVLLLAPTIAQARIALRYIRAYLRNSKTLAEKIVRETKNEITLDNRIIIGCYASVHARVRGKTVIAAVCDELAHWPSGDGVANSAEEILAAIRPSMATIPNAKIVKISTPFGKSGPLWEEFEHRSELDFAVFQLSTFEMNLTVPPQTVERERRRSEENYQREYNAQFTDVIHSWIVPEILDPCITRGRQYLPRQHGANYVAAIDPASRANDFALVIVHQAATGSVVVDYVASWIGTTKAALPFESVLHDIADILGTYGVNTVVGDQFYADAIHQKLLELGIFYKICTFGAQTRARIFCNLKHLMVQGKLELPDDPDLLQQLRNLREEITCRGQVDVRANRSQRDDKAIALALAVSEVAKRTIALPLLEVELLEVRISPAVLGLIPGNCRVEAVCANFPNCTDLNYCLSFADQRVTHPT